MRAAWRALLGSCQVMEHFRALLLTSLMLFLIDACAAQSPDGKGTEKRLPSIAKVINLIGRPETSNSKWELVCRTPEGYVPQGLCKRDKALYLSGHKRDQSSALFLLQQNKFRKLFDFPAEATHTSGIGFHPNNENLLFAVDYTSKRVYAIDFKTSSASGESVVVASIDTGLRGPSACCFFVDKTQGTQLLITDFGNTNRNYVFEYDLSKKSFRRNDKQTYRNGGFSQGITSHGGLILESGNRFLDSYITGHDIRKSLQLGAIDPLFSLRGPDRGIEDIVIVADKWLYASSETSNALYRTDITSLLKANDALLDQPASVHSSIFFELKNIHDLAIVLTWNEGSKPLLLGFCEDKMGVPGRMSLSLDASTLQENRDYVVIVLYKGRYAGPLDSRTSGEFKTTVVDSVFWQKKVDVREAGPAIKYWKVFGVALDDAGHKVLTAEVIPGSVVKELTELLGTMEDTLKEKYRKKVTKELLNELGLDTKPAAAAVTTR